MHGLVKLTFDLVTSELFRQLHIIQVWTSEVLNIVPTFRFTIINLRASDATDARTGQCNYVGA